MYYKLKWRLSLIIIYENVGKLTFLCAVKFLIGLLSMIKNAQMTVISPERYNWVSDVLRLDGGEVQDRADHRYRHQCMLPGGHPECPYIGGNARFAIICVIAPTFLPTYLVPNYLPST